MYHVSMETQKKLVQAFGFNVDVIGATHFEAHGERRTVFSVKRPNGKKQYRAVRYGCGSVVAV